MDEVFEAVELAFAEKGLNRVQMPPKLYLTYQKYAGDLRTMPAYLEGLDISAVKVVNVHPENRDKFKLPTVMAIVIMINPKNGAPIAIMAGTHITKMRTGAAGGIAAKYLARKESRIVGLVGAGAQARTQLMGLLSFYKHLDEVRVWSRKEKTKEDFVAEMQQLYSGNIRQIIPVERLSDAVRGAHIVTTTTPSRVPIVMNEWITEGMHINCIGADASGKQELDPAILKRAKIIVDDIEQASHSGEINVPLSQGIIKSTDIHSEIGRVVADLEKGRTNDDDVTVFVSTGLAIQDAVTGNIAYKKAIANRIGQIVEML